MSAKQAINDKLQCSLATYRRCSGVVNNQIKKGLLLSPSVNCLFSKYLEKTQARTWLSSALSERFSSVLARHAWDSHTLVCCVISIIYNDDGGSAVAEWLACWTQALKSSGSNRSRQTVHTHRASLHQAAKLVAALLRVARVTAGLAESNGSLPPGLWLT